MKFLRASYLFLRTAFISNMTRPGTGDGTGAIFDWGEKAQFFIESRDYCEQ